MNSKTILFGFVFFLTSISLWAAEKGRVTPLTPTSHEVTTITWEKNPFGGKILRLSSTPTVSSSTSPKEKSESSPNDVTSPVPFFSKIKKTATYPQPKDVRTVGGVKEFCFNNPDYDPAELFDGSSPFVWVKETNMKKLLKCQKIQSQFEEKERIRRARFRAALDALEKQKK